MHGKPCKQVKLVVLKEEICEASFVSHQRLSRDEKLRLRGIEDGPDEWRIGARRPCDLEYLVLETGYILSLRLKVYSLAQALTGNNVKGEDSVILAGFLQKSGKEYVDRSVHNGKLQAT